MSVNPASPMKNINMKRVGTRGLGSISRKDNRSDISLSEIDEKKRHHREVLYLKFAFKFISSNIKPEKRRNF